MSTKLDAVNTMLRAIGEAPVSSLTSGVPDAEAAETVLDSTTREVLAIGWGCNVDLEVPLQPDVNGHILLADEVLSIDTSGRFKSSLPVVPRIDPNDSRRKLYNIRARSFIFPDTITCRITYLLDFEGMTFGLQRYIAEEAALRFQADALGSSSLDARRKERRAEAWAALQDEEAANDGCNILTSSPSMAWTYRNNPLYGR